MRELRRRDMDKLDMKALLILADQTTLAYCHDSQQHGVSLKWIKKCPICKGEPYVCLN